MLLRLLFLGIGLMGFVPILYMVKTAGTIDSSHYRYATIGLCAGIVGFLFGLYGLVFGGVCGLVFFKTKEDLACDCIEFIVKKIKFLLGK